MLVIFPECRQSTKQKEKKLASDTEKGGLHCAMVSAFSRTNETASCGTSMLGDKIVALASRRTRPQGLIEIKIIPRGVFLAARSLELHYALHHNIQCLPTYGDSEALQDLHYIPQSGLFEVSFIDFRSHLSQMHKEKMSACMR